MQIETQGIHSGMRFRSFHSDQHTSSGTATSMSDLQQKSSML
jgi:hypothetical protein